MRRGSTRCRVAQCVLVLLVAGLLALSAGAPRAARAQLEDGPGMNDGVSALAVASDGTLYAGGFFTTAGGVPANRVARWDGSSWAPLGSGISSGGMYYWVGALAVGSDGTLYAGGGFTTAGGVSANNIARWTGSGWAPMSVDFSGVLLANPSFEQDADTNGLPDGWTATAPAASTAGPGFTGPHALQLGAHATPYVVYQAVPGLQPGVTYDLGAWVNSPATTGSVLFAVQWRNAAHQVLGTQGIGQVTAPTSGWQPLSRSLVAPAGTAYAVVVLLAQGLDSPVLVDDVTLRLGNLVRNGGFEWGTTPAGTPQQWVADSHASVSSAAAHSGSAGLQLSATDDVTTVAWQPVAVQGGVPYHVSAWLNIPSTPDAFEVRLAVQWRDASNTVLATSSIPDVTWATGGWQEARTTLAAPAGAAYAVVALVATELNATVYVDDVVVRP